MVQADAREPDWSAALGAQPSSGAVEGIPERQGGVAAPPLGSGAYEALSAQRSRLLAALDGCRHDAIAAVRAAAGEARAAAAGLAARPSESGFKGGSAGGGSGDGGSGGGGGGRASPRRRSLKTLLAPSSSALQGFQRPKLAPGELSDFGIQVYAPPSPPRQLPARPPETDHGQQGRLDREALDGQGGGLASPAGSSLGSRSWSHGGSDQGRQPAQPRDAPLSSPPPAVSTGAAAQWPHAAAEEGHASGVRAAACAGAAPEAASPPGSPPYLYHVQADSVLPGSPGVSRIEVAHTVQGRVELVYGAGGAAAAAVPLLLPSAGGMAGGLLAEAAAHSPLQRARAADGVPLLPGAAASGASRGAARVPSADSCAPMLDAVYNEWQRALPSLHALAQPQPRRAGGAAPASPWPEPLQSAHLGKESGAAAASQRALHRRPSDAADTSPCDAPHCEDAPHAAPGSLSQALAAVHQASSRVGSLLRELSGASVGAKPAASTGIGAATEGPAGSAAPAMVPAAAAAAAGASVAAAAAAAAEGLQLVDAGMCMHSPRPQPGQTGGSKSAGEASAPAPWQQHSTQDARRCSGAATPPVVVVPATAPPAAAQHFDAAGTWQQRTAASGDANAAVTALDAVAAQAPAGSPSSGAAGPAAAAAAPAAQAFSTDSDRARTAAWAPNSEAELLMALSWRLQRLASSGGGSRATASGDPQSAPPEGGMLAGSEPGAGGLDHTLLRARLWASAPGLPPCVTAPQAPGALSTPVPGSSGGGASWVSGASASFTGSQEAPGTLGLPRHACACVGGRPMTAGRVRPPGPRVQRRGPNNRTRPCMHPRSVRSPTILARRRQDIHRELQLLRDELDNHARQPLASLPSSGTSGGGGRGALPETWDDAHGCAAFSDGGMQAGEGVAQLPPAAAIMLGHLLAEEARARSHSGAAAPPSA